MKLLVFIFIVFLILLICFGFLKISFELDCNGKDIEFKVFIYRFDITKFIIFKKKQSRKKDELIKSKSQKNGMDINVSIKIFRFILNRIRVLKKKPKFIIYSLIEFGLSEADLTAIIYGYISCIFYPFLGFLSLYFDIGEYDIQIKPIYNEEFFKLYFRGILSIKIVQIIYISFLFITLGRKFNGATSDRKFNENYS